jgi:E3 SUMO-protein ligase NSE2
MSDNIEEDDATQRREPDAVDAVEDEDQQNRQARSAVSRSGRGESSKMAAAQSGVANERDEDAEDATPVFDADSFGNKPLGRHDGQKLQGMASDWNMIETQLKETAFSLLTEVSAAVAEYADDSTARKVTSLRLPASFRAHSSCLGIREAGRSYERDHWHWCGD